MDAEYRASRAHISIYCPIKINSAPCKAVHKFEFTWIGMANWTELSTKSINYPDFFLLVPVSELTNDFCRVAEPSSGKHAVRQDTYIITIEFAIVNRCNELYKCRIHFWCVEKSSEPRKDMWFIDFDTRFRCRIGWVWSVHSICAR